MRSMFVRAKHVCLLYAVEWVAKQRDRLGPRIRKNNVPDFEGTSDFHIETISALNWENRSLDG